MRGARLKRGMDDAEGNGNTGRVDRFYLDASDRTFGDLSPLQLHELRYASRASVQSDRSAALVKTPHAHGELVLTPAALHAGRMHLFDKILCQIR